MNSTVIIFIIVGLVLCVLFFILGARIALSKYKKRFDDAKLCACDYTSVDLLNGINRGDIVILSKAILVGEEKSSDEKLKRWLRARNKGENYRNHGGFRQ